MTENQAQLMAQGLAQFKEFWHIRIRGARVARYVEATFRGTVYQFRGLDQWRAFKEAQSAYLVAKRTPEEVKAVRIAGLKPRAPKARKDVARETHSG